MLVAHCCLLDLENANLVGGNPDARRNSGKDDITRKLCKNVANGESRLKVVELETVEVEVFFPASH